MPEHPVPVRAEAARHPAWGASPSVVFFCGSVEEKRTFARIPVEAALLYAELPPLFQWVLQRERKGAPSRTRKHAGGDKPRPCDSRCRGGVHPLPFVR